MNKEPKSICTDNMNEIKYLLVIIWLGGATLFKDLRINVNLFDWDQELPQQW